LSPEKKPITGKAYAKINLTFEVLGKRRDGYHEIISIMQAISLCDVLTFEPHDGIQLACDVAELVSPNNLAYKAATLMQGLAHGSRGVAITLSKGIPPASGLGGGSSDAAVALQILNKMWGVNLPQKSLIDVAAQLGSDVPFFVSGSLTALTTGRGEKVEALPSPAKTWVVLLRASARDVTPADWPIPSEAARGSPTAGASTSSIHWPYPFSRGWTTTGVSFWPPEPPRSIWRVLVQRCSLWQVAKLTEKQSSVG
jgi:4-diphosphocytidyl-2C-methyl-D-erythritol kinase